MKMRLVVAFCPSERELSFFRCPSDLVKDTLISKPISVKTYSITSNWYKLHVGLKSYLMLTVYCLYLRKLFQKIKKSPALPWLACIKFGCRSENFENLNIFCNPRLAHLKSGNLVPFQEWLQQISSPNRPAVCSICQLSSTVSKKTTN